MKDSDRSKMPPETKSDRLRVIHNASENEGEKEEDVIEKIKNDLEDLESLIRKSVDSKNTNKV